MLFKTRKRAVKQVPDFTSGPLFVPIFKFALALMVSNLLSSTYHFADNMVVGKFSGDAIALAAMSCTGAISGMLTNFVSGLSSAVTVVISRCFGAKDESRVSRAIHTSILFAALAGLAVAVIGPIITYPMLELTGAKAEYIDKAAIYLIIIFIGYPFTAVSAFTGCVLISVGEAKTSVTVEAIGGFLNLVLNIMLVAGFGMSVAGVATATVISKIFCVVSKIYMLYKRKDIAAFRFKRLCLDGRTLRDLFLIGIPASLQNSLSSISNLVSVSALNTLPTSAMSGIAAANSISSYANMAAGGYGMSTTITVVGQNYGAKNYKRVKMALKYIIIQLMLVCGTIAAVSVIFAGPLSTLFVDMKLDGAAEIIRESKTELYMTRPLSLVTCTIIMLQSYLRTAGYSILPMIASIFSSCIVRVCWNLFIFPLPQFNNHFGYTLGDIVSTMLQFLIIIVFLFIVQSRIKRKLASEE